MVVKKILNPAGHPAHRQSLYGWAIPDRKCGKV